MNPVAVVFAALCFIVLAARQMGEVFARFKLPLISGFLVAGVLAGPFVFNFIPAESIPHFLLLDELALAFIAFAAGAELERHVLQGHLRSIVALIGGQVIAVLAIGIAAFIFVKDLVPFMADLPHKEVLAIAMLGSTVMIARSPSSALAIIKELRARGPFTHKVLGATVLMDAVVIMIFAAAVSAATSLVEGASLEISLLFYVLLELLLDVGTGLLVGIFLLGAMHLPSKWLNRILILAVGLGVFTLSTALHDFHLSPLPVGLFSEPLLICLVAGFYVTNFSALAPKFRHTVEEMAPGVFLLFFTLVGVELQLDVITQTWGIVLTLFVVRAVAIFVGSIAGMAAVGDRSRGNALLGLGFITQAGVSIGLAKEIGVEFGAWGNDLATLSIGVIVFSQVIGPPFLKLAINSVGEAHVRAESPEFDGIRDVLIFGVEGQSLALARQLESHEWNVVLVTQTKETLENATEDSPRIELLPEINKEGLEKLNMKGADSVVLMFSDEDNYEICELIYEHFGIENVIVRLQDRANSERFKELKAHVVEPGTTMVSLLEQFVRSPFAASLLLGMDPGEDFVEIEMGNRDLDGVAIREIHFPHDVLVLAISRKGDRLVSHGYTRLQLGDHVTVVGSPDSLAAVEAKFES